MSSGESGESLASRLADAEAALLFARVNEKRLSEENSRYRERVRGAQHATARAMLLDAGGERRDSEPTRAIGRVRAGGSRGRV